MGLLRRIKADYVEARKNKEYRAKVLNTLHTSASDVGRIKGNRETSDEEVMVIINAMIKNNTNSLSSGMSGSSRKSAVEDIKILKSYLPQMLTNDELEAILADLVNGLPVRDIVEKDRVINKLEEYYLGRYNRNYASKLVDGLLS